MNVNEKGAMGRGAEAGFGQDSVGRSPASGDRFRSIMALVVGLGVGVLGGAYFAGPVIAPWISGLTSGPGTSASTPAPREPHSIHTLENLVVNPAQTQGMRFLVVTVAFEVAAAVSEATLESRDVEIRDSVLRLLSEKTVSELSSVSSRDDLKDELREVLESRLGEGQVHEIYFPQFVIQ